MIKALLFKWTPIVIEDGFYQNKMPELGEDVLITTEFGNVMIDHLCDDCDGGVYWEDHCCVGDARVIAWAPLPPPYEDQKPAKKES